MDHKRLDLLIKKYLDDACNDAEKAELNEWFLSANYGDKDFEDWVKDMGGDTAFMDKLYKGFESKLALRKKKAKKIYNYRVAGIAASVLICLFAGMLLLKQKPLSKPSITKIDNRPVLPGSNKAILTLADGSKMVLDDKHTGKIANQPGMAILKTKTGQIIYTLTADNHKHAGNTTAYNTIQTLRGEQFQVVLPDGTHVWLNAESSLRYPLKFSKTERKVEFTGEGYFEVAHNKFSPFKVKTGQQEIKVLGTHFNINGYNDEPFIKTTLLEGSVQVTQLTSSTSRMLTPGQQSSINFNTGNINIKAVNTDEVISWKNGYFLFDDQSIQTIMKAISRWYDVDIVYQDSNLSEKFGGTFSRSADLADILTNLQTIGTVHFKMENRKIFVDKMNLRKR